MFHKIRKAGDTLGFSGTPYLVTNVQCFAWVIYCSLTPGRQAPLATNALGMGFETVYCALFLFYAHGDVRGAYLRLLAFSTAGCLAFLALVYAVSPPNRAKFVGYVAIVLNIISYSAPLGVMGNVIKTKSVARCVLFSRSPSLLSPPSDSRRTSSSSECRSRCRWLLLCVLSRGLYSRSTSRMAPSSCPTRSGLRSR
jgi:Sugar efflux transporter for intercellular exchange